MKRLTIKELAPYLPYGITGSVDKESYYIYEESDRIGELKSIDLTDLDYELVVYSDSGYFLCNISEFKPLLRPLSYLTEEIEHNGERFVPIKRIQELFNLSEQSSYLLADTVKSLSDFFFTRDLTDVFRFETVVSINSKLHEWHFDTANLLGLGLALPIDVKEV